MKTIHNINKWSFMITLLLYITIYFGLLAQVPLAFIQCLLAISVTSYWFKLNPLSKKMILTYWLLIIFYFLTLLILGEKLKYIWMIFYSIIPMSIAGYFVYTTYTIYKSHKPIDIEPYLNKK